MKDWVKAEIFSFMYLVWLKWCNTHSIAAPATHATQTKIWGKKFVRNKRLGHEISSEQTVGAWNLFQKKFGVKNLFFGARIS